MIRQREADKQLKGSMESHKQVGSKEHSSKKPSEHVREEKEELERERLCCGIQIPLGVMRSPCSHYGLHFHRSFTKTFVL